MKSAYRPGSAIDVLAALGFGRASRHVPSVRCLHQTGLEQATALPVTTPGPPPPPPASSGPQYRERIARQRQRNEILRRGHALPTKSTTAQVPLRRRFWKDVTVQEAPGAVKDIIFALVMTGTDLLTSSERDQTAIKST